MQKEETHYCLIASRNCKFPVDGFKLQSRKSEKERNTM